MSSYISISSIKGIFREVDTKKVKFGVVPIENSSNGIVTDTINCLSNYNLKIIAEVVLDIHHTLATTCDKIKDIKRIYSKDIAFDQCRKFLTNMGLDEVEQIPIESTTKAAKIAAKNQEVQQFVHMLEQNYIIFQFYLKILKIKITIKQDFL
jgi:chorismate mutase/prephenate dehydratase